MDVQLPDATLPIDPPHVLPSVLTERTGIHKNPGSYAEGRKLRVAIVSGTKRCFLLEPNVRCYWLMTSSVECRESHAQGEKMLKSVSVPDL